MTSSAIKRGQFITLTASEQAFYLDGNSNDREYLQIVIGGSTSAQMTVSNSDSPVINNTYTTYTTEGFRELMYIDTGAETFRCAGSGTLQISW